MYSREISVVRTRNTPESCVKGFDHILHLNRFAKLYFDRRLQQGFNRENAFQDLKSASTYFRRNGLKSVEHYCCYDNHAHYAGADATILHAKFMMGEVITTHQPHPADLDDQSRLTSFVHQLSQLATSTRKASQLRDYITSVWVDCPGYKIPTHFQTRDVASLLEDDILQKEKNTSTSLAVSFPASLFGDIESGAFRRPTKYLGELEINSVRDIYAVLPALSEPIPVSNTGSLPVHSMGLNNMSISSRANSYRRTFVNLDTGQVFACLKQIVNHWPENTLHKVSQWQLLEQNPALAITPPNNSLLERVFERWVLSKAIPLLGNQVLA